MKEKSYWVSEVNRYIKHLFDSDFALGRICVKGEVSNCKYHSSGHIYFTLKDSGSQLSCIMFASHRRGLRFQMQEGQSVVVKGNISVYERDGSYQLYAKEIQLDGAGLLYERYLKLKQMLEEEGLFDQAYKQPVPTFAKKVGIVTAVTGAAIQDIQNIARRRNPSVQLYLYPAQVQGQGAAETIARGIQILDQMDLDVLIVGRGGGSIEDLWAFNEEMVARAIFECETPIISAVGHETDVTIADFVADLRAPTPSAAAELAVADVQEWINKLQDYRLAFQQRLTWKITQYKQRLEQYQLRVEHNSPERQVQQQRQRILTIEEKLTVLMDNMLQNKKYELNLYVQRLDGLSPLKKMKQGYAFVTNKAGQAVKSVKQVRRGSNLKIAVTDGEIFAKVEDYQKEEREQPKEL